MTYGSGESSGNVLPFAPGMPVTMGGLTMGGFSVPVRHLSEEYRVKTYVEGLYDYIHHRTVSTQVNSTYDVVWSRTILTPVNAVFDVLKHRTVNIGVSATYDITLVRSFNKQANLLYDIITQEIIPSLTDTFEFLASLGPGDVLQIDMANMRVTLNGNNVMSMTNAVFFDLLESINRLQVTDESSSRALEVKLNWRDKYLY